MDMECISMPMGMYTLGIGKMTNRMDMECIHFKMDRLMKETFRLACSKEKEN